MKEKKVRIAYGIWSERSEAGKARVAVGIAFALFFAASFGPETLHMLGWL